MIDLNTEVCVCNSVTFKEVIDYVQKNNIKSLDELLEHDQFSIANKCESCLDVGYNNDGLNLPLAFSLAQTKS